MSQRSLKASNQGIRLAKIALVSKGLTQRAMSEELGVASWATISKFFNGKPISRTLFIEICQILNLNWEEIVNPSDDSENVKIPPGFQLQYILQDHQDFITRISWSPDGNLLASPSVDGTICLWERETGRLYKKFKDNPISIFGVAWSPDAKSLIAASDDCFIRVWSVETGELRQKIAGCTDVAFDIAWSPDGQTVAIGLRDSTIQLWDVTDVTTWQLRQALKGHSDVVWVVKYSLDGHILASGSKDKTIRLWDAETGEVHHVLQGHSSDISSLSWSPDKKSLASAGFQDVSIRIWNVRTGRQTNILEGHTKSISSVSFSADGNLLASKSEDRTVQIWHCANWTRAAILDEPMDFNLFRSLAFHPKEPLLATLNQGDIAIRVWDISLLASLSEKISAKFIIQGSYQASTWVPSTALYDLVDFAKAVKGSEVDRKNISLKFRAVLERWVILKSNTIQYTTAKIVLVGESNVGKSCLGLRLAEDRYEEQGTTHGMRFWTIEPEQLNTDAVAPEGEKRDVVLWDMGGQVEYRLVHQLFLHDTTLALVLFDPTRGRNAFEEAEAWSKRIEKQLKGQKAVKLLVGTKLDEESNIIDQAAINRLVEDFGFAGYNSISAKNNRGIAELRTAISEALDWNTLAKTSRPELFQSIHDEIGRRRKDKQVVLLYSELEEYIRQKESDEPNSHVKFDAQAVDAVVNQLAVQGAITDTKLSSGERALVLQIGEVERYAGSIIIAARNNLTGVPAIEEQIVASPRMAFPGIKQEERLPRLQERVVLECIVQLLIQHGICLQHEGLLIFPSLFQPTERDSTGTIIPHSISLYYDFSGAIDNIYSSLIVLLAISERFGRVRLWEDRAEFEWVGQGVCGLRKVERRSGFAHIDVYFDQETADETRNLFISFVEEHLRQQGVEIYEHVEITCVCGYAFSEDSIRRRVAGEHNDIGCPECDQRTKISEGAQKARERDLELEDKLWALRTEIEDKKKLIIEEAKSVFEQSDRMKTSTEPLRILHLSDLHIRADADPESMLQPLIADVQDSEGGLGFGYLDYLVISGDLTNIATSEEFEKVRQFVSGLIDQFQLTAERCIVVPGNHDLSWNEPVYTWKQKRLVKANSLSEGSYLEQGNGFLVRVEDQYPQRFKNFSEIFYHPLVMKEYPLKPEEQCIPFLFTDTKIQFLAMNSCWEIDEFFPERSSIYEAALTRGLMAAAKQIEQAKQNDQVSRDAKILRIAVWHHPVTGNEKMQQDAFLDRLRQAEFKLCLHGHIHEERTDIIGYLHPTRRIHVAGTGSFGAPTNARPESTPRLYNLLEIERDHSKIRVHTRCLRKGGGAWEGWAVWHGQSSNERRTYYEIPLQAT
jgi:small GTP-binding protein